MPKLFIKACITLSFLIGLTKLVNGETIDSHWNLSDLYPSTKEWNGDGEKLGKQIKQIAQCRGHLGSSATVFKSCLETYSDLSKRFARMSVYASLVHDQDTSQNEGLDLVQKADLLGNQISQATAFFAPEILKIGGQKISKLVASDPSTKVYSHMLEQILKAAPHTLSSREESMLADFGLFSGGGQAVYSILANSDMPWPKIKLSDGKEVTLDQSAYTKYRAVSSREDRQKVYEAFWSKFKSFENTFGVTYYEQLKSDLVYAKLRNYPDSINRALDANHIPIKVYDTLIDNARSNLPTLHRYFKLRAKMLGVKDLAYYDIYPPLVNSSDNYPLDKGVEMMEKAVLPLGSEYANAMHKALNERWMDVYPKAKKRSGAYMNGAAYDVHPYLLLNYNNNYESVSTLAHEWGHAMHSYLANHSQAFINADYPIFTAEIASTTNEVFLLDSVLKEAKSDDEKLLYLGSALENLRGTFFRQAMFADFEREVHAKVDKGESLTGQDFTLIYGKLLKQYHGHDQGVVRIDDAYAIEWAYIPHFYNSFYVYQYATSVSAGSMFASDILKGVPGAKERYLNVLKAGGSEDAYELVKRAGVDLATPTPYKAIVARMNLIMDQMEEIIAKKK